MIEPTSEMREAIAAKLPMIRYPMYDADALFDAIAAAVLAIVERDQAGELAELRALFQLQWTRSREADARWRAEDPEARANVWPDLGVLLKWLMDDADKARAAGPCSAVLPRLVGTGEIWCELRYGHAGDHTAEGGTRWKERGEVHQAVKGDSHVHCCGIELLDLPRGHRWTTDPHGATCRGPS